MSDKNLELVVILLIKKKRNKYEVFTSINENGLLFTEEELVENRIIKGASFTKEIWDKIINNHEQSLIYEKVLKSENKDVKKKLENTKGFLEFLVKQNI